VEKEKTVEMIRAKVQACLARPVSKKIPGGAGRFFDAKAAKSQNRVARVVAVD
jgi:hypothetical protein